MFETTTDKKKLADVISPEKTSPPPRQLRYGAKNLRTEPAAFETSPVELDTLQFERLETEILNAEMGKDSSINCRA